ncbi:conserved hypothetical protein [Rhodospirillaceae bacterium LM-1]|nr:conserved hypothetical protein [Rhodospirillaceae bacterium LM-1]
MNGWPRMGDEERTTAIGLARYACEYYEAAIAADDVLGTRPGYETVAPVPVMFLVAHAIELILKAYLRHKGFSISGIRQLNHGLKAIWGEARNQGIEDHVALSDINASVLEIISELHSSTELRYIKTGYKEYPVFGPLQELAEKLLRPICPLVGFRCNI